MCDAKQRFIKNEEFLKTNKLQGGKGTFNLKPRRLNLKFMSAVKNDNETSGNWK
jgi:hypothetical protein